MGIFSAFKRQKPKEEKAADEKEPKPVRKEKQKKDTGSSGAEQQVQTPTVFKGKNVVIRPMITEKTNMLNAEDKYVFRVGMNVSKQEIKRIIENQYKVHVEKVNVMNMPSKARRRGREVGRVPGFRKAVVAVKEGESIDLTA